MNRQFLVTKFKCAVCGGVLNLTYDKPQNARTTGNYCEGEPTGAAMVEQHVYVEPCVTCFEPVKQVRGALKTLARVTS